jgi:hypothetical protein
MLKKLCRICNINKPTSEFYKQTSRGALGVRGSCKVCDNLKKQQYRAVNKDRIVLLKKAEYERNKEHHLAQKQMYRQANKAKINALVAARKKVIKQRTPLWLTDFDKLKIQCFYSVASMLTRENKEPWHVDHIVPLQGKLVNGFHTPNNLQVMRGLENISKKNKFEVAHA